MVRKSRNFDGCWTCRSRKVKCDLQRPKCQRCIKAGIDCAGYNIKLGWSNPLSVSPLDNSLICLQTEEENDNAESTFQRRNIEFVRFPNTLQYETFKEVSYNLSRLDIITQQKKGPDCRVGPFSVYKIEGLTKRQKLSHDKYNDWLSDQNEETERVQEDNFFPTEIEGSIFSRTNNSWVHYELLDSAKLTTIAIKGIEYKLNEQNMLHILYPKYFPNIDSDDWIADQGILKKLFYNVPVSNDLQLTHLFKELLNKFKKVTLSFVRVQFANNYWESIIIPFINHIICEFICMNFASWSSIKINTDHNVTMTQLKNNIKLGIIYLIFSLSAFKVSNELKVAIINENETYHMDDFLRLSIQLRKMSITLLNYHLDEYDNNMNDETLEYENLLLLCIILQIQVDNYFSVFENYELLFAIADFIIQKKFKKAVVLLDLSKYLISIFKLISIFFESTHSINVFNYAIEKEDEDNYDEPEARYSKNGTTPSTDENIDQDEPSVENMMGFPIAAQAHDLSPYRMGLVYVPSVDASPGIDVNSIYLMYGIPASLIKLFSRVVDLTNHKSIFQTRNSFPKNYAKVCNQIEQTIVSWDVNLHWHLYNQRYNPILKENEQVFVLPFHEALFHNIHAFYNALMVYFYRLVREEDPEFYQHYIRESLMHLQKLCAINRQLPKIDFKPSFWILLICGSDALDKALQQNIKSIWATDEMSHFNYWRGKQLLYEVWKRREIGESYSWMDMVREWDIVLCLV